MLLVALHLLLVALHSSSGRPDISAAKPTELTAPLVVAIALSPSSVTSGHSTGAPSGSGPGIYFVLLNWDGVGILEFICMVLGDFIVLVLPYFAPARSRGVCSLILGVRCPLDDFRWAHVGPSSTNPSLDLFKRKAFQRLETIKGMASTCHAARQGCLGLGP